MTTSQSAFHHLIEEVISNGRLVRLHIVKSRGVRFNLPGRILKFDEYNKTINVYHVDEKQVYTFYLNEIEDMIY